MRGGESSSGRVGESPWSHSADGCCMHPNSIRRWRSTSWPGYAALPLLMLCLSTSLFTIAYSGDAGSVHPWVHHHKSRVTHSAQTQAYHRPHTRSAHRALVDGAAATDDLGGTLSERHVPPRVHMPVDGVSESHTAAAVKPARVAGESERAPGVERAQWGPTHGSAVGDGESGEREVGSKERAGGHGEGVEEGGGPVHLPKPLAEGNMADLRQSAVAESDLFHVPERLGEQSLPTEGFVYVYDLPSRFNTDILGYRAEWHPEQYDTDIHLHRHLATSSVRTDDPTKAKLFLLPVYIGRYYDYYWQQWSPEGAPWAVPGPDGGWEKWEWAMGNSSLLVRDAITHVRQQFPFWNRSEGADHFMVFAYDKGRCEQAILLQRPDVGRMFFIQSYNDLVFRSDPTLGIVSGGGGTLRTQSYDWTEQPYMHCFKPNVDVAVPAYASYNFSDIIHPHAGPRNISVLGRFGYKIGDGKNTVQHHGHRLRKELLDWWAGNPIAGGDFGAVNEAQTEEDMRNAIFCVCPPGHTQDTSRVWRAIILGCIPVTFFRAVDLPFRRFLGVRYQDFVVNIQPDDYKRLATITGAILADGARLRRMQLALAAHQRLFVWQAGEESVQGVFGALYKELSLRTAVVNDYMSVF